MYQSRFRLAALIAGATEYPKAQLPSIFHYDLNVTDELLQTKCHAICTTRTFRSRRPWPDL
jgi:hypothetical protein